MSDTASSAILAWIESNRLHNEHEALLNDQTRRLALILAELRQRPEMAAQVDELMVEHGVTVQWDALQAAYGATPTGR